MRLEIMHGRDPESRVDSVDAEDREIQGERGERRIDERADELERLPSGDSAGDDDANARPHRELVADVQGVGDDRHTRLAGVGPQSRAASERAGDLDRGGAAVQPDGVADRDELEGGFGDPQLLVGLAVRAELQRPLEAGAERRGAAAGPRQHALIGQELQVAAGGRLGDAELLGDLGVRHGAAVGHQLKKRVEPLSLTGHRAPSCVIRGGALVRAHSTTVRDALALAAPPRAAVSSAGD